MTADFHLDNVTRTPVNETRTATKRDRNFSLIEMRDDLEALIASISITDYEEDYDKLYDAIVVLDNMIDRGLR